jgi:hypothetical protein
MPCSLVKWYQRSGGTWHLHLQGKFLRKVRNDHTNLWNYTISDPDKQQPSHHESLNLHTDRYQNVKSHTICSWCSCILYIYCTWSEKKKKVPFVGLEFPVSVPSHKTNSNSSQQLRNNINKYRRKLALDLEHVQFSVLAVINLSSYKIRLKRDETG